MKTKLSILLLVLVLASCASSKQGCPGANSQGPKFKSKKFDFYNGQ